MSTDYYRHIRRRFVFAVIIVVLVLAGLFCWYGARERENVISSAEKRSASYASAIKEHAERVFSEADNSLIDLIEKIAENGGMPSVNSQLFRKRLRSTRQSRLQFSTIFVVDRSGDVIAHSQEKIVKSVNVADRDYFIHHRDNPSAGLYISRPYKSRLIGEWHFNLSRQLRDADGRFIGLVSVTITPAYFTKFYKSIDVGNSGRIILSSTAGDILALEPNDGKPFTSDFKSSILFSTYLPAAPAATHHVLSPISGNMRIMSYSILANVPIVAVVSYDEGEVVSSWFVATLKQAAIGGLLVALICALSWLVLRQLRSLELANALLEKQHDDLTLKAELLDAASDSIYLLDDQGQLIYFNDALMWMSGYSREELMQVGLYGIVAPEYIAMVQVEINTIRECGEAVFESAYLRKSGSILPTEVHGSLININGRILVMCIVRDISERKEIEVKLTSSVQKWQNTFDAVEDVVWLLDMEQIILRANKATQNVFGKSTLEVIGLSCCVVVHDDLESPHDCPFEQMLKSKKRASMQMSKLNKFFEVSVDPVFSEDGAIINAVHTVKDITTLKKAEHREQIRAEILERLAGADPLAEQLAFIVASIESENPEMLCSILLVSDDGTRLLNGAAPSLPDFYNRATSNLKIGEGIGSCGTSAFRRERVIVEDIGSHPFWKGFTPAREAGLSSCWSEPVISSAGVLLGTFAIYHREPAIPTMDEIALIQQASAFAGIAIERSKGEAERQELEHLLSQSQKMEAIGHLSGGIAHDFNNLLTPIMIYSDMLKRSLPDDEKVQSQLNGIVKASGKARDLTQQLLSFGRKQVMQMHVVDLNDVIMSFYSMLRRTLRENISFSLQLSSQPVVVRADSTKMEQVLLNLVLNAQDAIAVNGSISIETGQVLIDDESARRHPGMEPGRFVLFACADNGCGMSSETMSRIFEPFFSTKEVGHGTGLGLANVYGIVKQHNGYIMAVSTVGAGTVFKVYLPVCDETPYKVTAERECDNLDHSGSAVILLVEDNEMVRDMACGLLQGLGYTVYSAEHPERALELLKEITEKVDLVITDVVMPGMNGKQLFERITTDYPEINRVLYMSGYTNNIIVTDGELDEGLHFLQKPFTVDALMAKVRMLLHSPE